MSVIDIKKMHNDLYIITVDNNSVLVKMNLSRKEMLDLSKKLDKFFPETS